MASYAVTDSSISSLRRPKAAPLLSPPTPVSLAPTATEAPPMPPWFLSTLKSLCPDLETWNAEFINWSKGNPVPNPKTNRFTAVIQKLGPFAVLPGAPNDWPARVTDAAHTYAKVGVAMQMNGKKTPLAHKESLWRDDPKIPPASNTAATRVISRLVPETKVGGASVVSREIPSGRYTLIERNAGDDSKLNDSRVKSKQSDDYKKKNLPPSTRAFHAKRMRKDKKENVIRNYPQVCPFKGRGCGRIKKGFVTRNAYNCHLKKCRKNPAVQKIMSTEIKLEATSNTKEWPRDSVLLTNIMPGYVGLTEREKLVINSGVKEFLMEELDNIGPCIVPTTGITQFHADYLIPLELVKSFQNWAYEELKEIFVHQLVRKPA
ncbi:hypothetical protein BDR26DRAFT_920890 [Obelidium mucronatum]|nr:hypothetical protein BDR26DRAFT_920890 [Obelidium mucronatum]